MIDFVNTLRSFNVSLHVVLDSPPNSARQVDTRKLPELERRMQESVIKNEHLISLTKCVSVFLTRSVSLRFPKPHTGPHSFIRAVPK